MDDDEDIHDRLEQLEATVADQQATIEQLTETPAVGRRSVVASLLGAGAVGGLAGYGSQSARAQASGPAGQVGTGEEPVDGFLWDLDVQNGAEFNGSDVTGVGALDVDETSIGNVVGVLRHSDGGSAQSIPNDTETKVEWDSAPISSSVADADASNNEITIQKDGKYRIEALIEFDSDSNWSTGDEITPRIFRNSSQTDVIAYGKTGTVIETFGIFTTGEFASDDVFDIRILQDSGDSKDLSNAFGNASERMRFTVTQLG